MLKIQEFIKKFPTIEEANFFLKEKLYLKIKKDLLLHSDCVPDTVFIYNYDMTKTPKTDPIAMEARGLILDKSNNIISMSFPRFFNYGEDGAAKIDWESARAETKFDGTLIVIYSHNEDWYIQTRQRPRGNGNVAQISDLTYYTAVEEVLLKKTKTKDAFKFFRRGASTHCFVFEFISPFNRIVTPYEKTDLVLLTVIDKYCEKELSFDAVNEFALLFKFKRPSIYSVNDILEVNTYLDTLDSLDEGFVIVDKHNNRMKIKNKEYLAVAKAVNAGQDLTLKHFAAIALKGDADEIIVHFPKYSRMLTMFTEVISQISDELHYLWSICADLKDQKQFALVVRDHSLNGVLFAKRSKKIDNIDDALSNIKPEKLVTIAKERLGKGLENELKQLL